MAKAPQTIVQVPPLYVDREQIPAYTTLSVSLWDKLVAKGEAPKARKLSDGRSAWLREDIDEWGRSRPVSDLLPPRNSGHGRAGKLAA